MRWASNAGIQEHRLRAADCPLSRLDLYNKCGWEPICTVKDGKFLGYFLPSLAANEAKVSHLHLEKTHKLLEDHCYVTRRTVSYMAIPAVTCPPGELI